MSSTNKFPTGILLLCVLFGALAGVVGSYGYSSYAASQVKPNTVGSNVIGAAGLFLVTQNDTTLTRAFNTSYQNILQGGGSQAMLVTVTVALVTSAQAGSITAVTAFISTAATGQFCNCYTVASQTHKPFTSAIYNNTGNYGEVQQYNLTAVSMGAVVTLKFWVPSGFYFMVNNTRHLGATDAIKGWLETVQPTGFGGIIAPVIFQTKQPF
jgi:hypothetical protein